MPTPLSVGGTGITIDYTNSSDPVLKIPFTAIAGAINWTTTPTAGNEHLDPWVIGLLQNFANYATNNPTNEGNNIVVSQPTNNAPVTRNGIQNRKNSRYTVTVYSTSTSNPIIDGDEF